MSDADKPKIEELPDGATFWKAYRDGRLVKGFDVANFYLDLAEEQKKRLAPGARADFTKLCKDGCFPIALAALVALLRLSPQLESYWAELVDRPDDREKSARDLEKAVKTIESLFGNVISAEKAGENELAKIGHLPVSQVTSELRFYIQFINFAATLSAEMEIRSPVELSKYLLTSYIRKMTGRFHDKNVSGLIQELVGPANYDEVNQRMWRNRNYKRIDVHFSWMTRMLVAASVVIAQTP
jgi:hypothetical protein